MKIFVTGTSTGVGKTMMSTLLAYQARMSGKSVIYYKPVQTGTPKNSPPEDPDFVRIWLSGEVPTYNRYCFEPPVAPAAADIEQCIDLNVIAQDVAFYEAHCDLLLIEGAGGLMVPLTKTALIIDLIQQLSTPVLLVAHSQLGTMNHTLLSLEALSQRHISLYGLVINFYPERLEVASDPALETLLPTLTPYLPQALPVWTCPKIASLEDFSRCLVMEAFENKQFTNL